MKQSFLLCAAAALLAVGCSRNRLDVDVSDIKATPLKVMRLEEDLFSLNGSGFDAKSEALKEKYGAYYEHYLMNFLNRGGSRDSLYKPAVMQFLNDADIKETYGYIRQLYPQEKIEGIAAQADECVKRFKYHFPTHALPKKLVTCMSGWNYASAYVDSALVISLDMYLGDTAKFYGMLRYPGYQVKKMNAHYILSDLARGWLLTEFDTTLNNILIDHTIYYGKLFYAVSALLPDAPDSLVIGYTGQQLKYCKEYEKKLWGYFAEKNRLYENSLQNVRELTSEGPFTAAISKECPPRIAMWVGWQIVKSYMEQNKQATLEQLMREDYRQVLNKSRYRP